jgi:ABC-type branched-subunit amino acid transport system ATPase component
MTKESLIKKTLNALSKLPQEKVNEIADFADYISKKYEEEILQKGIQQLVSGSKAFSYLENEENIYTVNDLKEQYK